ncbi:MAG: alpha/beta hydrolase [Fibrobacterales bacterium]
MKIYGIGGLGADKRVFQNLSIYDNLTVLNWLTPDTQETIESYALRMSQSIPTNEEFILVGVSFGGLIATEINKIRPAHKTILISSIETYRELPILYRFLGVAPIIPLIPTFIYEKSNNLIIPFFEAQDTVLLRKILEDTDATFLKWALQALVSWKNSVTSPNIVRIHGDRDRLLPGDLSKVEYVVEGGAHFMVVDRAHEVSVLITKECAKYSG